MDDMNAFERQVADEVLRGTAPPRPVDVASVFAAIATDRSPKRRFQIMFSATKFVVAGAIVALFGGFLLAGALTTQPSDDRSAAQEEPAPATAASWVTGTVQLAPSCVEPERTVTRGLTVERGYSCEPQTWESDDPRLGGSASLVWNADVYWFETERYSVINALYDIQGEAGGWTCRNSNGLDRGSGLFTDPVQGTEKLTCDGHGANEGLTAILVLDPAASHSFEGLIFNREVPPQPDLPTG
jgi:hypothetical protein